MSEAHICFFRPGSLSPLDLAEQVDGQWVSPMTGITLSEYEAKYPGVEVCEFDAWYKRHRDHQVTAPAHCSEEEYVRMLNVLPPVGWAKSGDTESFKISERIVGDITRIYCKLGSRYVTFQDDIKMTHVAIVDKASQLKAN